MTKEYKIKIKDEENSCIILTGDIDYQTKIEEWVAGHTDSVVNGITILTDKFPENEEKINEVV